MNLEDAKLVDALNAKHVRWTYESNGEVLAYCTYRDPNSGKLPGQFEQCRECKKLWPCDTARLLDLITSRMIPA